MRKLTLLVVLAIAALGPLTRPTFAGDAGKDRGKGRGSGEMLERLKKELSLTDNQVTKIKPILEDQAKQVRALREDKSTPNDQKRTKYREIMQKSQNEIGKILTPDQKKKWEEATKERGKGKGKGEGKTG